MTLEYGFQCLRSDAESRGARRRIGFKIHGCEAASRSSDGQSRHRLIIGYAIYYGIKTGFNDAFIIDNQTYQDLVTLDSKSAEIIKPIVRGRDIRRYRPQWARKWLIDTHNGYNDVPAVNIDDYPVVKAHLDSFYTRLAKRYDKGKTPYNLRNCAYHADFTREKLIWMDMAPVGRFAYSDQELYCNNKGFLMTGNHMRFLCGALNSCLVTWFVRQTARTTGLGLTQWEKFTVERIPIPFISADRQRPLVELVDRILAVKDANPSDEICDLEEQIDKLVYDLYGLTTQEVKVVQASLSGR